MADSFSRLSLVGFVYANSVVRQTEEGLPGSGGNSKLTGNPQPSFWAKDLDQTTKSCLRDTETVFVGNGHPRFSEIMKYRLT